jgi:hypothetical protein
MNCMMFGRTHCGDCDVLLSPRFPDISLIVPVILASFQDFTWFFKEVLDFTPPFTGILQGSARKT